MPDTSRILPIIKDIMYSNIDLTRDYQTLENYLKYYLTINKVLIEALEAATANESNPNVQTRLFRFYSEYVKAYELLLNTDKIVRLGKSEKEQILSTLESLTDINELDDIVNELNHLKVMQLN